MPGNQSATERCPKGHRCESCGTASPDLAVHVREVLNASMCLTLCGGCAESGRPPSIMLSTAEKLAEQHRQHRLGYTTAS